MIREVVRSPYWTLSLYEKSGILRVTRTSLAYPTLDELERDMQRLLAAARSARRPGTKLLVDVREAPSRNDEVFERAMNRLFPRIFEGMAVVATVVKTAIGRLHIQRLSRERNLEANVFLDEREAFAFLQTR